MASLRALQKKVPAATSVAGRVIAFYNGKHVDFGEYVGDDSVLLSKEGEAVMNPPKEEKKPTKGLDIDSLEI